MGNSIMHCGREYSGGGEVVVANPSGSATDDLDTIQIGETIYDIPGSGGGGTTVVANPSGEATADLETIQIGETIYDIPGSGGGSGKGYTTTCIWDYVEDNSGVIPYNPCTLTLNQDINNFESLVIELVSVAGDISSVDWNSTVLHQVDVNALNNLYNNNYLTYTSFGERASRFYIKDTTFQKTVNNLSNVNGIVRVYGIKYRGESGGSFIDDIIYENTTGVSGASQQISITKAVSNYDAFAVVYSTYNDGGYATRSESYYSPAYVRSSNDFQCVWYPTYGNRYMTMTGDPESTTVTLTTGVYGEGSGYTPIVYEVHGIKYGGSGGGTDVEANPQDTPTDILETIKIGETTYDISGSSGSSGYVEDVLFKPSTPSSTNTWSSPVSTGISKSEVDDYDMLVFGVGADDHTRTFGFIPVSRLNDSSRSSVAITTSEQMNAKSCYAGYDSNNILCVYTNTGTSTYVFDVTCIKYGCGTVFKCDSIALPTLYSENEKIVGVWTDGKPLYQKTINMTLADGLLCSIQGAERIIIKEAYGIGQYQGSYQLLKINYYYSGNDRCCVYSRGSDIYAEVTSAFYSFYTDILLTVIYTKTTDQPVDQFDLSLFGIYSPVIYSTTEREIGVWTDGKPLYQKTIDCGSMTVDTNTHDVAHNISNIDKVVFVCGIGFNSSNESFPLPNYRPNTQSGILFMADRTNVTYMNNWTAVSAAYATIRYTKTTDVAGSGSYAELGVPAVHYDTSEHVIGTYFGKPLYKKGFEFASLTFSSQSVSVNNDLANIEDIVNYGGSFYESRDDRNIPLPFTRKIYNEHVNIQAVVLNSDHSVDLQLVTNSDWYQTIQNVKIWLEYTKTTD